MITEILVQGLSIYVIAILICESYAFERFRDGVNWLFGRIGLTKLTDEGEYEFITCRLCVGFWTGVVIMFAFNLTLGAAIAGYGLAVFLESIEKE